MMKHLMIDIEALGYFPNAIPFRRPVIVQIGMVPFDLDAGTIGQSQTINVEWASEADPQGPISPDTVRWWLEQDPAVARSVLLGRPRMPIGPALALVNERARSAERVWAKGTDYDLRMLNDAWRCLLGDGVACDMIDNRKWRDARICYDMLAGRLPNRAGLPAHDAAADAFYQASVVCAAYGGSRENI